MAEENNTQKLQEAKRIKDEIRKQNRKNAFYFAIIVVVLALWILLGILTIRQLWWLSSVQKTPLDLILVIFVITVLTVMADLAVRFLHKRMTEKDQEITRWRTKLLDAYGCLLETEVKNTKSGKTEKVEKDQKISELEKKLQETELNLKINELETKIKLNNLYVEKYAKSKECCVQEETGNPSDQKNISSEKTSNLKNEEQVNQ